MEGGEEKTAEWTVGDNQGESSQFQRGYGGEEARKVSGIEA